MTYTVTFTSPLTADDMTLAAHLAGTPASTSTSTGNSTGTARDALP